MELVQWMLELHKVGKKTDLDHSVLQMCLAEAARSGSVEMVDLWLHLGANPTQKGPGLSAMASALMSGNAVAACWKNPKSSGAPLPEETLAR
jgi:hypothetical protein